MKQKDLKSGIRKSEFRKGVWTDDKIDCEVQQILNGRKDTDDGLGSPLTNSVEIYAAEFGTCYFHTGEYTEIQITKDCKLLKEFRWD